MNTVQTINTEAALATLSPVNDKLLQHSFLLVRAAYCVIQNLPYLSCTQQQESFLR
jgi:hypothetical protein